jgi:hypothetical protein
MSEAKKPAPPRPPAVTALPGAALAKAARPHQPRFAIAASGDNVVLVDVFTGRTWALALEDHQPVWQPVVFGGPAGRAPGISGRDAD